MVFFLLQIEFQHLIPIYKELISRGMGCNPLVHHLLGKQRVPRNNLPHLQLKDFRRKDPPLRMWRAPYT